MATRTRTRGKKKTTKYVLDVAVPVNDGIIEVDSFELFLKQRIKVNNKAGDLGDVVRVNAQQEGADCAIVVSADIPFSKRYLKYLAKKYLKKHNLRDYVRVVSQNASQYTLKYYKTAEDADAAASDDE